MELQEESAELEDMERRLKEDGLSGEASAVERQRHLWRLLRCREDNLLSSTRELHSLRSQQATEMKEVESYVEHIRGLLDERESLTADYEQENEQLRAQLQEVGVLQDAQLKEVTEMLEQEGLAEISRSSPSEQVAYLLVERATLLERLEAAERSSLKGALLQGEADHSRGGVDDEARPWSRGLHHGRENMSKERPPSGQSPWKKLFGVRKTPKGTNMCPSPEGEDLRGLNAELQRLQRDLDEASRRLDMAHDEIRRLTDELDSARKTQSTHEPELQRARQEVEQLKQEVDKLRECGNTELRKAKEHNERLDVEIRVLRGRVRTLDSERKTLLEMVPNVKGESQSSADRAMSTQEQGGAGSQTTCAAAEDQDALHKRCRCRQELEDKDCQLRELQRRLEKLRVEQEEVVERNEELESLLGEAQNQGKAESEHHECEVDGLQRKIKRLEAELSKSVSQNPLSKIVNKGKGSEQLMNGSEERAELLESRLLQEREWRKQLQLDVNKAQAALKKDKEELQKSQKEVQTLHMELDLLQADRQQAKALSTSFTQVKAERAALEDKVSQLEHTQSQLQCDLKLKASVCSQTQEDLRESRAQASELRAQVGRLLAEMSSVQRERNSLRKQVTDVQGHSETPDFQAQLDNRQSGEAVLEVESKQSHSPAVDTPSSEVIKQLGSLKLEASRLQSILEEERLLAGQHQVALQAQVTEAQARVKSQDSLLQQKAEEMKHLRQSLQRAESLFTSAERELRYERDKNLDLKKHNALLEQEKVKLCAEVKQTQAKGAQLEERLVAQTAEAERLQQMVRELELEGAQNSRTQQERASLQEELSAEKARLIAADNKVFELQQQLKNVLHQLRVEEARTQESGRLERESRDMAESLCQLRTKLQEEQLQRKLLEQREAELQQKVRCLHDAEAAWSCTNAELERRLQQLEAQLRVLEGQHSTASEKLCLSQSTCVSLQDQLTSSQQECEGLKEELQAAFQRLDTCVRKYEEKRGQHVTKLRRAKQVFVKEMSLRDERICKLENELSLATVLSDKEREWTRRLSEESEAMLSENRELMRRLSEAEEAGNSGAREASSAQLRADFLEVENKQLQERVLVLFSQVGAMERALRNVQSAYSLEDVKKVLPENLLSESLLYTSQLSVSGTCHRGVLAKSACRAKVQEQTEGGQGIPSSEIGYLNVTSPIATVLKHNPEDSLSTGSDDV